MKQSKLRLLLIGAVVLTACTSRRVPTSPAATRTPTPFPTATAPPTATVTPIPSSSATPTPVPLSLQFSYGVSPSQQTVMETLIAQFNQTHPEIQVVGMNQGTSGDPVKAASHPDVAMLYPSDIAALVQGGWIAALDGYLQDEEIGFAASDMEDIAATYVDRYPQFGNRAFSVGFMRSMEVMYYNADLLRAAGFGKPPETWDEFAKMCAAVSKPPDVYCYEMKADATDYVTWVYSRGGDMVSANGRTAAFNQKEGLEALTLLKDLFRKKFAITASRAFQEPGDFAAGKVAFTFDSTLGLGFYDRAVKGAGKTMAWGIAPLPRAVSRPVVNLYGPSLAIYKTAEDKQRGAFAFAKWLMDQEPSAAWAQATGYFPARASTKTQLADFLGKNPQYANAFDWLPYGRSEPNVAGWNTVRGFIADAMVAVASGKATPEDALREAARKANEALGVP